MLTTWGGFNRHIGKVHADIPLREKFCPGCDTTKSVSAFPIVSGASPVRYRTHCYDCKNKSEARYRAVKSTERTAAQRRDRRKLAKLTFGLTLEEYDAHVAAFQESQGGKCPGCSRELDDPRLDHCHDSMKVRGLLCRNCNIALGLIQDSPETLRRLAEYLELTSVK